MLKNNNSQMIFDYCSKRTDKSVAMYCAMKTFYGYKHLRFGDLDTIRKIKYIA